MTDFIAKADRQLRREHEAIHDPKLRAEVLAADGFDRVLPNADLNVMRCPICDMTCISCAERSPEFDTTYGPMCGQCVGNGQAEPDTESARDHTHTEGTT